MASRKEITKTLTDACSGYWVHKTYSVFKEVGLNKWGRRRADVIAINHKSEIVITEVKSCNSDFSTDQKFTEYLPFCHRMYFCVSQDYFDSKAFQKLKDCAKLHGIGIQVLDPSTGYIKIKTSAKKRTVSTEDVANIMVRLAWRGGLSKRTQPRRKRLYIGTK